MIGLQACRRRPAALFRSPPEGKELARVRPLAATGLVALDEQPRSTRTLGIDRLVLVRLVQDRLNTVLRGLTCIAPAGLSRGYFVSATSCTAMVKRYDGSAAASR